MVKVALFVQRGSKGKGKYVDSLEVDGVSGDLVGLRDRISKVANDRVQGEVVCVSHLAEKFMGCEYAVTVMEQPRAKGRIKMNPPPKVPR